LFKIFENEFKIKELLKIEFEFEVGVNQTIESLLKVIPNETQNQLNYYLNNTYFDYLIKIIV
jgi:hypothetical protein